MCFIYSNTGKLEQPLAKINKEALPFIGAPTTHKVYLCKLKIIVPKSNLKDIIIDKEKKIQIIPVEKISEVLREALDWKGNEALLKKLSAA